MNSRHLFDHCSVSACFAVLLIGAAIHTPSSTAGQGAPSASAVWDSTAGYWSEATKWSTNPTVPNNGNGGFVYNVTQNGGGLEVNQPVSINAFTITGGLLMGPNTLTTSGTFDLTGGTITNAVAVNANGGMSISGGATKAISGGAQVIAGGGASNWTDGTLLLNGGSTFKVASGATFDTNFDGLIAGELSSNFSGNGTFVNEGTFIKSGGTGSTTFDHTAFNAQTMVFFNNSGTVQVNSGTLDLQAGGTSTGAFNVASGAKLNFGSTGNFNWERVYDLNSGSTVQGAGTVGHIGSNTNYNSGSVYNVTGTTLINGGVANFNAGVTASTGQLELSSGSLGGSGALTVTGLTTFTGGAMSGSGTVNANGGVAFSGAGNKTVMNSRVLNTSGESSWTGGNILLQNSAQMNNQAGGVFEVSLNGNGAVTTDTAVALGGAAFTNAGTFTVSGNTGTVSFTNNDRNGVGRLPVAFNNTSTGVVNVNVGTLELQGGGTSSGQVNVASGSLLKIGAGQAYTLASGAVIQGAGSTQFLSTINTNGTVLINTHFATSGGMNVNGGTVSLSDGVTTHASTWSGGAITLSGGGTVTNKADSTLTMTFDGSVNAGSGSGTFVNEGAFIKNGGTGNATIGTSFTNSGSVQLDSGTLALSGSSTHTGTASISVNAGTTLAFSAGTHTINAGAVVTGAAGSAITASGGTATFNAAINSAGELSASSSGTLIVNATANVGTLSVNSLGSLGGTGIINVSGMTTLTNAFGAPTLISGSGTLNANGGINLTLNAQGSGGAFNMNDHALNNGGTATTSGSFGVAMNSAASITNRAAGTWTENGTVGYSGGTFNNQGMHIKASSGNSTVSSTYNNTGTTRVDEGTLTLTNVAQHSGATLTGGTWEVNNGASLNFSSGSNVTTNQGSVMLNGAGSSFNRLTDELNNNEGSFTLKNNRDLTTAGAYTNSGSTRVEDSTTTMTIGSGGSAAYTQTIGETVLVGGALIDASVFNLDGGELKGTGTVASSVITSGTQTIAPGLPSGVLTIDGDLTLSAGSTLAMDLGGLGQGMDYDLLDVNGTLTLAGLLNLSFLDDFQNSLQTGDLFTIATSDAAVLGSFSNVANGGFLSDLTGRHVFSVHYGADSIYNPNDVVLYAATPEPSRTLLLMLGILGLTQRRKRCACAVDSALI